VAEPALLGNPAATNEVCLTSWTALLKTLRRKNMQLWLQRLTRRAKLLRQTVAYDAFD
jgi:hypothetical protein